MAEVMSRRYGKEKDWPEPDLIVLDGGDKGGEIVATGTPEEVAKVEASYTGQYLGPVIERTKKFMGLK